MSEVKDPAIKLFGKTIPVPEISAAEAAKVAVRDSVSGDSDEERVGTEEEGVEKLSSSGGRTHDTKAEDGAEDGSDSMMSENQVDPQLSALPKESSGMDSEADLGKDSKVEDGQEEKSNPQDKTLKKPDKILPCPRCNSMDTKFCYYNNYNVNQPRHFCKSCQRYWTAGGSMRNVAVGAGRRKNKNSVSQCRSSDNIPNGIYHPAQNSNGAVLTFGTDSPLCESMAAVLSIAERIQGAVDVKTAHPYGTVDDTSSAPKEEAGEKQIPQMLPFQMPPLHMPPQMEAGEKQIPQMLPFQMPPLQMPPQMVPFPGAPWPYPWVPVQWSPQTVQTVPTAFCTPGFQMGFYPTAPPTIPVPYWGCPMPGGWGLPWINPPLTPTSGPLSPSLGKHPRDDSVLNPVSDRPEEPRKERVIESDPEKCLYVPKTLRINNPKEAAKSSIWETLGIKDDPVDSPGASLFKAAFPSKGDEKAHVTEASSVLQANPAALSRSITFHERS